MKFDEIGYWSEIKLDIVKDYASAYSRILTAQRKPALHHVYIDAFAGAGVHISKTTREYISGSPINALLVQPPFREYHLIDIDRQKVELLWELVKNRSDVHIHEGDCNRILLEKVFPNVRWEQYRRGLCLLDPYGLQLDWKVIETAGKMRTIDMFLNFPVADMNRNVLWRHPEGVDTADLKRMNEFWGDESWREIAYTTKLNLFGYPEKEDNAVVAEGFRQRLLEVAGFKRVVGTTTDAKHEGSDRVLSVLRFTEAHGGRYYHGHLSEVSPTRGEIMAANSHIEWTEATWNPVTGCTKISAGCKNCYAERLALRLEAMGNRRYRNGFRVTLHDDLVDLPKSWRISRMIFVNSMSDLFHKDVPLDFIQRVFATMRDCSQHTFQILTKRSDRLLNLAPKIDWPPNVWMGVSIEDSRVLYRIDDLRRVSAAIRFLSCEPLIGSLAGIDLTDIHWVIVGGESGFGARPMKIEWVREIFRACRNHQVPFFFKQWGGVRKDLTGRLLRGRTYDEMPVRAAA